MNLTLQKCYFIYLNYVNTTSLFFIVLKQQLTTAHVVITGIFTTIYTGIMNRIEREGRHVLPFRLTSSQKQYFQNRADNNVKRQWHYIDRMNSHPADNDVKRQWHYIDRMNSHPADNNVKRQWHYIDRMNSHSADNNVKRQWHYIDQQPPRLQW